MQHRSNPCPHCLSGDLPTMGKPLISEFFRTSSSYVTTYTNSVDSWY